MSAAIRPQPAPVRRRRSVPVLIATAGVLLAACGSNSTEDGTASANGRLPEASSPAASSDAGGAPSPAAGAESGSLPAVAVLDAATGATVAFADIIPAERPLLFWFWAPH